MPITTKILYDYTHAGTRLICFQLRFPKFMLAQFNTHRMLSRNASSSRAISAKRMIEEVEADPFIPEVWGKAVKSMHHTDIILDTEPLVEIAKSGLRSALDVAKMLDGMGVHKQVVNRYLEPWAWCDVVATANERDWLDYFSLRTTHFSQPEHCILANMMQAELMQSVPQPVESGFWAVPFVGPDLYSSRPIEEVCLIGAARCARVSYSAKRGAVNSYQDDIKLAKQLLSDGHMSPFEHVAMASQGAKSGNFSGWIQLRHHHFAQGL